MLDSIPSTELILIYFGAYACALAKMMSEGIRRPHPHGHGNFIDAVTAREQKTFDHLDPFSDEPFPRRDACRFSKSSEEGAEAHPAVRCHSLQRP